MTTKADYIRSDQLADARIPIEQLPDIFNVTERTIRRWITADNITTHAYGPSEFGDPHGKAIRWGDLPINKPGSTRWHRH